MAGKPRERVKLSFLRLDPGSVAIDAGNDMSVPAALLTDLDGRPRFADAPTVLDTGAGSAPVVDIGPYER